MSFSLFSFSFEIVLYQRYGKLEKNNKKFKPEKKSNV